MFLGVSGRAVRVVPVAFGIVWIRPLYLDKAFAAYGLVAASRVVQVRWVREETYGTFGSVLVEKYLQRLSVDKGVGG